MPYYLCNTKYTAVKFQSSTTARVMSLATWICLDIGRQRDVLGLEEYWSLRFKVFQPKLRVILGHTYLSDGIILLYPHPWTLSIRLTRMGTISPVSGSSSILKSNRGNFSGQRPTEIFFTRKYPLRGYILGVLMHTTAWDRLWGGDVFLRLYIYT